MFDGKVTAGIESFKKNGMQKLIEAEVLKRTGKNETPEQKAIRELQEETGAVDFTIEPVCVYSVTGKNRVNDTGEEIFGMLYYAEINKFDDELDSEMEKVVLLDELPSEWTYPLIQPKLIEKYLKTVSNSEA